MSSFFKKLAVAALTVADARVKAAEQQAINAQAQREHDERVERAQQWAINSAARAQAQSGFYQAPIGAQVHTTMHTVQDAFGGNHRYVEQVTTLTPRQQELENMKQVIQGCRERCAASKSNFHKDFFMRDHFSKAEQAMALWSMNLDSWTRKDAANNAVRILLNYSA